ncbi:MAG: class I SAM-dependent methyltransferase, partial [Thermoplasmata archaeon]|nr:class I SAM-dependent methyltransferase [Thermoplasmata archaeon]
RALRWRSFESAAGSARRAAILSPSARERTSRPSPVRAEATIGRSGRILDLGCGPGSLSLRVLRRFPRMHCVAVDYDPVVLRIGKGALGAYGGRLTWVDAKLGGPAWTDRLAAGKYDAAISTTALHWLEPKSLRGLYRDLGPLLRPHGIFLNGDRMPWDAEDRRLQRLAQRVRRVWFRRTQRRPDGGAWRRWWKEASEVPDLAESFAEHRRRQAGHPKEAGLPLTAHVRALRRAGFRTVAVLWQSFEHRVLFAQR